MKILLCLLPVLANAQININIQASKSTDNSFYKATGFSQNNITKNDETLFNITDQALKNAVLTITKRIPTNVYLTGPTPWNDLYTTYKWAPVKTIIKPHAVKLIKIETSDVVLKTRELTNKDAVDKHQELTLMANIVNKMSSSWEKKGVFAGDIKYNIDVVGSGKVPTFEHNSTFGEKVEKSKIVSIRSALVKFDLKPESKAIITFLATKVKATIAVDYWVMLQGNVATNNEEKLGGHHFWAYDVVKVMRAAKLPHLRKVREMITIEFYTDDKIVVS